MILSYIAVGLILGAFLGILGTLALIVGTVWYWDRNPQRIEHVYPPCQMCSGASDGANCDTSGRFIWLCYECKAENDSYAEMAAELDEEDEGEYE